MSALKEQKNAYHYIWHADKLLQELVRERGNENREIKGRRKNGQRTEVKCICAHPVKSKLSVYVVNRDVWISYPPHLLQSPWRQALGAGGRPAADRQPLVLLVLRHIMSQV